MIRAITTFFVAVLIIGIIIFVVWAGIINYTAGFVTDIKLPIVAPEAFRTTVTSIILLSFVLGGAIGSLYSLKVNVDYNDAIKYYKKRISQTTQNTDNDSALIDSLQRKISSLEIALENALRDKNS